MSEEAAATPDVITEVIEALPSDWVNGLPEGLKDAPFLRPTKDGTIRTVEEVRSALENAAKLQGNLSESHIKIPSVDAGDADKAAARERILSLWPDLREVTEGEDTMPPSEIAGYKLPEGSEVLDAAIVSDIAQFALDHKWGQKQFADYAARMIATNTASTDQHSQWKTDQAAKLNETLGVAKDEHLGRVAAALESVGAPADYIEAIKAGNIDADQVLMIDNLVGKMIDMGEESSQFVQQVNTGARAMTPTEHHERVSELRDSLAGVQKSNPKYAVVTRKIQEHMTLARQ